MPSVTPAATAPPAKAATSTAATNEAGLILPPAASGLRGDSGPEGSITAPSLVGSDGIPGEDQLAGGFEPGRLIEADGRLVASPRPDVPERHATLVEHAHGTADQRLPKALPAVLLRHVDLGDLPLQPGPRVEQDHPAEADHAAVPVPDREHHVLAGEARAERRQLVVDLLPGELRVVRVVGLLVQVEVHEQRLDQVQLLRRQLFDVVPLHRPDANPGRLP